MNRIKEGENQKTNPYNKVRQKEVKQHEDVDYTANDTLMSLDMSTLFIKWLEFTVTVLHSSGFS